MIEREAQRLLIKVPMVMANARGLLEAGRSALQPGEQIFDLGQVAERRFLGDRRHARLVARCRPVAVDRQICPYSTGRALPG